MVEPKYKRVVLKLSGEALSGEKGFGLDENTIVNISEEIKKLQEIGVEVSIVVGGGNFWRGRSAKEMDRTTSDYMGMLGTVINALALQDALEKINVITRVQSAIEMRQIAEPYIRRKAIRHLEKGRVVIFAAGSGNPYFSTDTAAALRAAEIEADVILLAKKGVDGVYDSDPHKNCNAKKFEQLRYIDVLNMGLGVMDSTATSLCMDNRIPLIVFGIDKPDNIVKVVLGEKIGTEVKEEWCMYLDVHKEAEEKMKKTISVYKDELMGIRAGRANPALLDKISIDYYGVLTPLNQVASVSAPEPRLLVIQPWDANTIPQIEKAILKSDLGLNPSNDGKVIRLPIPQLTEDRRKELVKIVKKSAENAKIAIRNSRREANDKLKKMEKNKEISEDDRKIAEDEIQEMTDKYILEVDELTEKKEAELMEV